MLTTSQGGHLLVDGWFKYARKVPYTCDVLMALIWGLSCGLPPASILPFFYAAFFTAMITHRAVRDHDRCSRKYGADWERYCKEVPYVLVPGVW
jgi:delta24(24(1))-sterol reductase